MPTDAELRRLGNQLWGRDVNRGTRRDVVVNRSGSRYCRIHYRHKFVDILSNMNTRKPTESQIGILSTIHFGYSLF